MPFNGLSDRTMSTLSQIVHARSHGAGNGLMALERRGYVVELPRNEQSRTRSHWRTHRATKAGVEFLAMARKAGW